mgnify:FL=1
MNTDYEQMELDTRPKLVAALQELTDGTIREAQDMILESRRQIAAENGTAPATVRNRHEAYGIAAEQYTRISKAVSAIKNDTATLLNALPDPNYNAVDATSSIVNSTAEAAMVLTYAAAEMKRTLNDLYTAEYSEPASTPLEDLAAAGAEFQEANPVGTDADADTEKED